MRCQVPRTGAEDACNCNKDFDSYTSPCEIFSERKVFGTRVFHEYTCKPNVSQRCKDRISEIVQIFENAPNVDTCKDRDPHYNEVMKLARGCNVIP